MKTALLLSGGYDSVACLIKYRNADLFFFNYNQSYLEQELKSVKYIERELLKPVQIIKKDWHTDIKNRNFLMIAELNSLGYNKIIIGTRNLIPLFDKYKDSNWLSLKILSLLFRIKIKMPLVGMSKKEIIAIVKTEFDIKKLYSTEL